MGDGIGDMSSGGVSLASGVEELFDSFVSAASCKTALRCFTLLCDHLQLDRCAAERPLYRPIRRRLNYWRANALWSKLDRRAAQHQSLMGQSCSNTTCVVVGAGPCGLRAAVELAFLGARVVLVEKRESFSRNNVLHLWPFTIHDLRGLGAKRFHGKFCAGAIDHISIRQLQLVLLKVALLLGVEVHVNMEFRRLVEPPADQHRQKVGWRVEVSPENHPVNQMEVHVVVGADGRRNTLPGFRRKEFRGKLAIAITANFRNRNSSAENKVEEISGVAAIFNQRFFQELRHQTGINLENIVYYKDDTHYFVMTAKKQSLLEKGVIRQDFPDTKQLLSRGNVDQKALQAYARTAADFSTNHQLPSLDFAMNHYGQPDVAMFDFTCMYASENAAMVRQRHGYQLLVTLVGDSLLEPFWPMGTGVARGFLAALDSAWMVHRWAGGGAPLDVLAERESLYRLLPQTTPENMQKNISLFSVDPATRYLNISPLSVTPAQVRHLVDTGEKVGLNSDLGDIIRLPSPGHQKQESFSRSNQLLEWCQEQTRGYRGVEVSDLTTSWRSGLALCALIHRHRPDLIDFSSLDGVRVEENARLGFDIAEREFGISPLMTVEEMACAEEPDSLSMVVYLSQFYQLFRQLPPPAGCLSQSSDLRSALIAPASILSRLGTSPSRKRNPKDSGDALTKRKRNVQLEPRDQNGDSEPSEEVSVSGASQSRVRMMANQLQAKLDENAVRGVGESSSRNLPPSTEPPHLLPASSPWRPNKRTLQQQQMSFRFREKIKNQNQDQVCGGGSDVCFFCEQRVYVLERLSAEGFFFHRSCFQCHSCSSSLRPSSYTFDHCTRRFYCLQNQNCGPSSPPSGRFASHRPSILSLCSAASRSSSAMSLMAATSQRTETRRCSSALWPQEGEGLLEEGVGLHHEGVELPEEEAELQEVSEEVLNRFNLSEGHNIQTSSEEEEEDEDGGRGGGNSEGSEASCKHTLKESSEEADLPHCSDPASSTATPFLSSVTPPLGATPSTASFVSTPDSVPDADQAPLIPAVIMETAGGRGSFSDITPELPWEKLLPLQERWAVPDCDDGEESDSEGEESEGMRKRRRRRKRHREAQSLPPPQPGSGALLHQLRALRENPPTAPVEVGVGGARNLLKAMFLGQEQQQKKRGGILPEEATNTKALIQRRVTDVRGVESSLDSTTLLHRCSLKPQSNVRLDLLDLTDDLKRVSMKDGVMKKKEEEDELAYIPHALAFRRSYGKEKPRQRDRARPRDSDLLSSFSTETVGVLVPPQEPSSLSLKETLFQTTREDQDQDQDLDAKITRRVQRAARRQAKQEQLKRLHKAQMIQRQLQQVEERQRELEERGVMVERALRGEADYWENSRSSPDLDLHLGGLGRLENPVLMQQWFQLVQQKNSLLRYEAELVIFARELELEDRQSRLQQELRERMAVEDHLKAALQLVEERRILEEMLDVVEQRNALVVLLEEQRVQNRQEDQDLEQVLTRTGTGLSWT